MNSKTNKKVDEKVDNSTRLILAIITLLIVMAIIYFFVNKTIPDIEKNRAIKQNICEKLCEEKNMSYETLDIEMNCLCNYKEEPYMSYVVGIIKENNTIEEPKPIIFNRSDGTKYTYKINRTTQKIICEDIK
jgi:hypothetical protein